MWPRKWNDVSFLFWLSLHIVFCKKRKFIWLLIADTIKSCPSSVQCWRRERFTVWPSPNRSRCQCRIRCGRRPPMMHSIYRKELRHARSQARTRQQFQSPKRRRYRRATPIRRPTAVASYHEQDIDRHFIYLTETHTYTYLFNTIKVDSTVFFM